MGNPEPVSMMAKGMCACGMPFVVFQRDCETYHRFLLNLGAVADFFLRGHLNPCCSACGRRIIFPNPERLDGLEEPPK